MTSGFAWDWSFAWSVLPALLTGFKVTVLVTLVGSVIAVVLGLALCVVRIARIPVLSPAASGLVYFLRGTPFLIQLYFLFYILPTWGLTFTALATGICAIGIYYAAFASEIYRAGIEDVPPGQWEAALTLGLPLHRVWFGVVLPQAVFAVIPMLGNLVIAMFKETAILSTITIMELLAQGRTIGSVEFRYIEPLTLVGVLYFIVSYSAARAIRRLEVLHAH